jgi:hypothetical protein
MIKLNKTEQKLVERLKFYGSLGFCQIDRSNGVRMRQAARTLGEKGIVTIRDHKFEPQIWIISWGENKNLVQA